MSRQHFNQISGVLIHVVRVKIDQDPTAEMRVNHGETGYAKQRDIARCGQLLEIILTRFIVQQIIQPVHVNVELDLIWFQY